MYRRHPFTYFNDLVVIVGNDMVEGNVAAAAQDAEDGNLFDEAIDLGDDEEINTPLNVANDLDEYYLQSNQSTKSTRNNPSPSTSRRPKRWKASMASFLDVISENIHEIREEINKSHTIKFDKEDTKKDVANLFAALKVIPGIS